MFGERYICFTYDYEESTFRRIIEELYQDKLNGDRRIVNIYVDRRGYDIISRMNEEKKDLPKVDGMLRIIIVDNNYKLNFVGK